MKVNINLYHFMGKFSRREIDYVFFFSYLLQKNSIWHLTIETICMKCQNLIYGGNKTNISIYRLLKNVPRVLCVKTNTNTIKLELSNHLKESQHVVA